VCWIESADTRRTARRRSIGDFKEISMEYSDRGRYAFAAIALVIAGCAEVQWQKGGADAATMSRDLGECRDAAQSRAMLETRPDALASTRTIITDPARTTSPYPYRTETDRFLLENDLTRACMIQRGYELAPAGKPVTSDR
jgi:hypothetical protein